MEDYFLEFQKEIAQIDREELMKKAIKYAIIFGGAYYIFKKVV